MPSCVEFLAAHLHFNRKARGGSRGVIMAIAPPPKTYESNLFHHDFVQFGKTLDCQLKLDCQILLNRPPKLTGWIRPCVKHSRKGMKEARSHGGHSVAVPPKFFCSSRNFVVPRKIYIKHKLKQKSCPPKNIVCLPNLKTFAFKAVDCLTSERLFEPMMQVANMFCCCGAVE